MSVEEYIIDRRDKYNYLMMKKDIDTGMVWVQESYKDDSYMFSPITMEFRCDGFKCGEYDSYLASGISRVLDQHPCSIQLSRWYPSRNPMTFISYGEYSIATRIEYIGNVMKIIFRRFTEVDGVEIISKYELDGVKHIEKFLKFLQM